ncbi:MAG: FHA domain-containing protein [Isosphaeraceae bacterium]
MPDSALDLFREACGLASGLTLAVRDPAKAAGPYVSYQLELPFALVGRDPQVDVVLHDDQVSRRHAYLQAVGGRVLCYDLSSRTKLRWDGEGGPRDRGWLSPGRDLWIGPYAMHWARDGAPVSSQPESPAPLTPPEVPTPESAALPRADFALFPETDSPQSVWQLDTRITLAGRSEACHLVLGHETVSRVHASLIRTPKGVWIVDLLSREGVQVNGTKVRWAWLGDGDEVRIGMFTFLLRYRAPLRGISRRDVPLHAGASHLPSRSAALRRDPARSFGKATELAARSRQDPPTALPAAVPLSHALSPVVLEPSSPAAWELAGTVPPQQLMLWQQQMRMMETFHDDMMLMVQMFMAMHREHLGAVKEELDKVRELSRELERLQAKLTEPAPPPGKAPRRNGASKTRETAAAAKTPVVQNGIPPASAVTTSSAPPVMPPVTGPLSESVDAPPRDGATMAAAPRVSPPDATTADRPAPAEASRFHIDITRRIAELQRERQGYWQRILGVINK